MIKSDTNCVVLDRWLVEIKVVIPAFKSGNEMPGMKIIVIFIVNLNYSGHFFPSRNLEQAIKNIFCNITP